ncbi:MAG TPA: hypothetical protein ENI53_01365 [Thermoplasmatales archaeon]|nr:hypothetical protein [Thermoplasmatales archaeon]
MEGRRNIDTQASISISEFFNRRIIDLGFRYIETYVELAGASPEVKSRLIHRLAKHLEVMVRLAEKHPDLPSKLKNYDFSDVEIFPGIIHPRGALSFVIDLLSEIYYLEAYRGKLMPDQLIKAMK